MKLLIEYSSKEHINFNVDGIILALEDYSVESIISFNLKEIIDIRKKFNGEVFVKINKNLFNDDIEPISNILKKLDSIGITGIFFCSASFTLYNSRRYNTIPKQAINNIIQII